MTITRRPVTPPLRVLAVTVALTLCFGGESTDAANVSWNKATNGNWSTAGNWNPAGPPDLSDAALIGNPPAVQNSQVILDQNDAVTRVEITDGMTFSTSGHTFSVLGDTFISGFNIVPFPGGGGETHHHSRIVVRPSPGFVEYSTDDLTVEDEGWVQLADGGTLEVRGTLATDSVSSIYGEGEIRFQEQGTALVNNGIIEPTASIVFTMVQGGALDLDGSTGGGRIALDWADEHLTINGGELADSFSGEILIDGDASLQMNLDAPWATSGGSQILFGRNNNGISPGAAVLGGTEVTIAGLARAPYGTHGRIDADVIYAASANVEALENARLEMNGSVEIDGGAFALSENADIDFDGETVVRGGEFTTFSRLSSQGAVRFNAETTWNGAAIVNGVALQNGDATVSGIASVNAGVFDMDGGGGTHWDINSSFVVTAESIDSTIVNTFDGIIDIGGGVLSQLVVNLTGAFDHWTMNGEMSLSNSLPFSTSRLSGSAVRVTGDLGIEGPVRVNADTQLASGSMTTFVAPDSTLILTGTSEVTAGAGFVGDGELWNAASGELLLADGANTAGVGVRNSGRLVVGDGAGGALVEYFESSNTGVWEIEIGGHVPISEHDLLMVAGGAASLDGLLDVVLADSGGGLFLPEVGDEFTVLTSLAPVSGVFVADPISFAAGQQFNWAVVYEPHAVNLVLTSITDVVPEPSGLAVSLAAMLSVGWRPLR